MRDFIKKTPILGTVARRIWRSLSRDADVFPGTEDYWSQRYAKGGNSGAGSYNKLAEFKAKVINNFVELNAVQSVIEYGCGDGNQLTLAGYPSYIGFDISPAAIEICRRRFQHDAGKKFHLMNEYQGETAELTLSLDVIYHLVEDNIYNDYMKRLFDSAQRFVIIYSSDFEQEQRDHERRRKFSNWITENEPRWKLLEYIPNEYPLNGASEEGSLADFYIYQRS